MKWEYFSFDIKCSWHDARLNQFGDVGWELVSIFKCDAWEYPVAYFKRPLVETEKQDEVTTDVVHGVDCKKVWHEDDSGGYMHREYDDGPYPVDGVEYCGRCHYAI